MIWLTCYIYQYLYWQRVCHAYFHHYISPSRIIPPLPQTVYISCRHNIEALTGIPKSRTCHNTMFQFDDRLIDVSLRCIKIILIEITYCHLSATWCKEARYWRYMGCMDTLPIIVHDFYLCMYFGAEKKKRAGRYNVIDIITTAPRNAIFFISFPIGIIEKAYAIFQLQYIVPLSILKYQHAISR